MEEHRGMKFEGREKVTNIFEEWEIVACILSCLSEICGYMVYVFLNLETVSCGDYKPTVNYSMV